MRDFLRFETMITPIVIQVIFWLAVLIAIIAGIMQIVHGGAAIITGILTIIFGPLVARIYCEIVILFFRINDHLRAIQFNTQKG
jgi:hypothetical protein